MKKIISKITMHVFNDKYIVDFDEIAEFQYGLDILFCSLMCLGLAFLVTILFGQAVFGLVFISSLTFIKCLFTSYHAKSRSSCCILYSVIVFVNMLLYVYSFDYNRFTLFSFYLFLIVIMYLRSKELSKRIIFFLALYAVSALCIYMVFAFLFDILVLTLLTEIFLIKVYDIKNINKNQKNTINNQFIDK